MQHSGALSSAIMKYQSNFQALADLYSDCGFDEFTQLYTDTSELMEKWAESLIETARSTNDHLADHLSFHHHEIKSYHELWKTKEELGGQVAQLK
jgi:hypothetical protein